VAITTAQIYVSRKDRKSMRLGIAALIFIAVVVAILFTLPDADARVVISELLYNPAGNDNDFEYVEIYGENETVTGWYFEGIDFVFPNLTIQGYAVIANTPHEDGEFNDFFDAYGVNTSFEFDGSLKNTGELIILRNEKDEIIDSVNYGDWAPENHSIEKVDLNGYSGNSNNWAESIAGGTPGQPRASLNDCDWEIRIKMNTTITVNPTWQIVVEKVKGGRANVSFVQYIENAEGQIVKKYDEQLLDDVERQRTSSRYSPDVPAGDAYFIRAGISNVSCPDSNPLNNAAATMIFVPSPEKGKSNESAIKIVDAPAQAKFGETIIVDVSVYRGDTAKYAISAFVNGKKKMTETKVHLRTSFVNVTIAIPILIQEDCSKDNEGSYDLIVEGFGVADTRQIMLECEQKVISEIISEKKEQVEKNERKFNISIRASEQAYANSTINMTIDIFNDKTSRKLSIEAYVSRSGSIITESKKKSVSLRAFEEEEIVIPLEINAKAAPGMYKLRAHILKEGRKTPMKVTKDIEIMGEIMEKPAVHVEIETKNLSVQNEITEAWQSLKFNETVYESVNERAQQKVPLILISSLALLTGILVFKKV